MSQLDVLIMGQAYKLACKEGEEQALQQAVDYLDEKMRAIRDAGKVRGNDRIAVMAALGIAAELLATKAVDGPLSGVSIAQMRELIAAMHEQLDQALTPQEALF
ncbi:MAG: hypothetical protein JWP36_2526 [Paucimonas sp.]|jgi:cell division protein ZapA|nr:hypothetical protein [Paucimonas sp.]